VNGSTQMREAIQTRRMTTEELQESEAQLASAFERLDGKNDERNGGDSILGDLELRKKVEEILNLHAERRKTEPETNLVSIARFNPTAF